MYQSYEICVIENIIEYKNGGLVKWIIVSATIDYM